MNNEKQLAQNLLKVRESGFPSPLISLFGKKKVHFVRYAAVALLGYMLWNNWGSPVLRGAILLSGGMIIGGVLKEMAFYRQIGANWWFTKKVTDWNVVSELAGDKEVAPETVEGE